MSSRLIGRHAEIDLANELMTQSTGLLVEGDAGVGKSRLLDAITDVARDLGWQIERAAGSAAAATVPFGAVVHLLPAAPMADRLRLLQQAHRALVSRAAEGPLLVVVDDAQLLDDGSAALVHRAASVDHLVVLAAVRTGEPVNASVTALWKDGFARRLELSSLPAGQARQLVEDLLNGRVAERLHRQLWRIGRGNPLFVRELIMQGVDGGSIRKDATGTWAQNGPLRITRLGDMVGVRLQGLHPSATELLECVAVGEPLELDLLEQMGPVDHLALLTRTRLIAYRSEGRRALVTTAHPLYGETVRAQLSCGRQRTVTASLAAGLTAIGLRRKGDGLRAARWQLVSGRTDDPAIALRGASEALSVFDFALAERLAKAGLEHDGADRTEGLHLLGRSLQHQQRADEAEQVLSEAMAAATSDDTLGQVVLARARNLFYSGRDRRRAIDLLAEGIARVHGDSSLNLTTEAALYAGAMNDFRRALDLCREVLTDPKATDFALLQATVVYTLVTSLDGRFDETRKWIDQGDQLAERFQHLLPLAPFQLALNRWLWLWGKGEVRASGEVVERLLDRVMDEDGPRGTVAMCSGLSRLERGDLVGARLGLQMATEELRRFDPFGNAAMASCVGAWILAQLGHVREARAALIGLPADPVDMEVRAAGFAACAWAWLAACAGDLVTAAQMARAVGGRAIEATYHLWGSVTLYQAVRLGAPSHVADLLEVSALHVREGLVPAMADHARALVDEDADKADSAARRFCEMGARLIAAEAYAQAAALHDRCGAEFPARRSATLSWLLQRQCPGAATPALLTRPPRLSDRETDVAVLAYQGLSSREIAARLYLSRRTVDNHLGSSYRQLGLHGRDDLRYLFDPALSA